MVLTLPAHITHIIIIIIFIIIIIYYYYYYYYYGAKGDWDFRISDLVKKPCWN